MREGDEVSFGCTRTIEKDGQPWPNPFVFKFQGVQGLLDGPGAATQVLEPAAALPHAATGAAAPAAQQPTSAHATTSSANVVGRACSTCQTGQVGSAPWIEAFACMR